MKNKSSTLLVLVLAFTCSSVTRSQNVEPGVIPFQGQLAAQDGSPLSPDQPVVLVFRLYDAPVGGAVSWEEVHDGISVNAGRFSVLLGSRTRLPDHSIFNSTVYLGITIDDGEPATADVELRPRQAIVPVISARYALNSGNASKLNGRDWGVILADGATDPLAGELDGGKIKPESIHGSKIVPGTIDGSKINENTITEAHLAASAVEKLNAQGVPGAWSVGDPDALGENKLRIYSKMEQGADEHTVFLMKSNTNQDGSKVFEDLSLSKHTIDLSGDVHHTTSTSKFGESSISFDGQQDYLYVVPSTQNSDDFNFGTEPFTIDFWVIGPPYPGQSDNNFAFQLKRHDNFYFGINLWQDGIQITLNGDFQYRWSAFPTPNEWYHVAVVRSGTTIYAFANGILKGTAPVSADFPFNSGDAGIVIGGRPDKPELPADLNAHLDEYRISKGIARWTSNFTPPTAPYPSLPVPRLYFQDEAGNEYRITATRTETAQNEEP